MVNAQIHACCDILFVKNTSQIATTTFTRIHFCFTTPATNTFTHSSSFKGEEKKKQYKPKH